jgi:flagellar basal-body rod modification protein FlgD
MIDGVSSTINATGTATSSATQAVPPGGKMGKDEFMRMLVAQLKNQDPLNPLQGEQMAAQLAQFSQLEQLENINTTLAGQTQMSGAMAQALNGNAAMAALGKTVYAVGNEVVLPGDGSGSVSAEVGGSGGLATLHLYDQSGREVGSRVLGSVAGGRQTFQLGSAAARLPAGKYTYSIEVKDSLGHSVQVQTLVTGRVDGVQYTSEGPVLTAGSLSIPFGTVVEIGAGN